MDRMKQGSPESPVLEDESFHLEVDPEMAARFSEVHRALLALAGKDSAARTPVAAGAPGYRAVIGCSGADPGKPGSRDQH